MGSQGCTSDEGTDRLAARAQGGVPSSSIPTRGSGDIFNQPDSKGMGKLFSGWKLKQMLWIYQGLGAEKDQASSDASAETPWLRLEQVE